ncbi:MULTISPECIES: hypothetical protein [unclassified Streptomyces]|uniref:hypothetical protein n=1 Tax=unclassified Streptomyces TaxID=2593676 RepID=UPI002476E5F6|nr:MULTISPECIES: hypothetical protein [unclassified Streptomyces]MDH6447790.1 hypothetical protein [Streptomyces sp. SAI-119]MDH6501486.1 hypothetical protein [Streptomyces sp. SAI-149]
MIGRRTGTVVVAGVLGLAGCGVDGGGGDGEAKGRTSAVDTPADRSPSVTPSPSPSASVGPSAVPVTGPDQKPATMTVTGGFAGVHRTVILRGDGTAYTSEKGEPVVRSVGADRFRELRTLLGAPALAEVPSFTRDMSARDLFQYTLTFGGRTVVTDRSGDEPALDRLIAALSELLPQN